MRTACCQKLGFANADLLQETDWDKVALNPRVAAPRHPPWLFSHDPEKYAYENYDKALESMDKGVRLEDEDGFEPNYPKGYKYVPWNIAGIMEDKRCGKETNLGEGDW